MTKLPALAAALALLSACRSGADRASPEERVRAILREVPLIDGHNDLPWQVRKTAGGDLAKIDLYRAPELHTDIPRLRKGGVGGQFWSVYVPVDLEGDAAVSATLEQIDVVHHMVRANPEVFKIARTAADVERIHASGRIASMMGVEGGHCIRNSMGTLRMFYRLGARYMTLTHSRNTDWADSATDKPAHQGLTEQGRSLVREMNRIGMIVDLSHVSPKTMHDALDVSRAPVMFSHSSARGVTDHPRNVPDDVLRRLPANGGVVLVTFVGPFVNAAAMAHDEERKKKKPEAFREWDAAHPAPRAKLSDVADHIEHVVRTAGIDHVGLGSDYDGTTSVPEGLENVSKYPALLAELLRRGYSDQDLRKIAGLNVLRLMRAVEAAAMKATDNR